jgi:formyl-CoA transferase
LGDYGAEVIKIEPLSGDDSRNWAPFHTGKPGSGTLFLVVNRNKRSVVVDLKKPQGLEIVRRLADGCDVLIQNFSAGVMDRLGLGHERLRQSNPRLIYCTISAFGETGPLAHARGYDPMMQAFSGMMRIPQPGEPAPARINIPLIDFTTGQNAFAGILAALLQRHISGEGAHIEVCLADSAMALQAWGLQRAWAAENTQAPPAAASAMSDNVPYESFETADGWIYIACGNNKLWQQVCEIAGTPELLADPRFTTPTQRAAHQDALRELLEARFTQDTAAAWLGRFAPAGVPSAPGTTAL